MKQFILLLCIILLSFCVNACSGGVSDTQSEMVSQSPVETIEGTPSETELKVDTYDETGNEPRNIVAYAIDANGWGHTLAIDARYDTYSEYVPFGIWEIVDSILAFPQYAPQEVEPWPLEPIRNGKRLTITDSMFSLDGYSGEYFGEPDTFNYSAMKHQAVDWDYLWPKRMTHEAEIWISDRMPINTVLVGFYLDVVRLSFYFPDRAIIFTDYDTILYIDPYYCYELRRIYPND